MLGEKWNWINFTDPTSGRIAVPEGHRVVSGIQLRVQTVLDRNTKMTILIQAAKKAEIIAEAMADELDVLRDQRNNVHIKALQAPEYDLYTAKMANDALNVLERFRLVAFTWTVRHREAEHMTSVLAKQATQAAAMADFGPASADDDIPF